MVATIPDLLRLVIIPVFAWAAWQDIHTRRVPNSLWPPLVGLGVVLLLWDAAQYFVFGQLGGDLFLLQVAISILFVGPLGYAFWWFGAFGAADAKALITLSILLPTFPNYALGGIELPLVDTAVGVFSLTILTNAVLIALIAPAGLFATNLLRGQFKPTVMLLARPVSIDSLPDRHGRLFETPEGLTHDGLDLDVLRMYLRWRGLSLAGLRAAPDAARNPDSIDATHDPTDGRSNVADDIDWQDASLAPEAAAEPPATERDDPWGVDRFFDSIEQSTYGTDREQLREGLELLAQTDGETVWVSPGLPFVVPLFVALVVAFIYGDLLFSLLGSLGIPVA